MQVQRLFVVTALAAGLLGSVGCFLFGKPKLPQTTINETTTHKPITAKQEQRYEIITRLLELPAGNDYLNRTVWVSTHDPLPHQSSAILAANGLRLGLMADPAPPEFDRYARSETHSLDARLRTTSAGTAKVIPLNAPHEVLNLDVVRQLSDQPAELSLTGAECAYTLTVLDDPEGRVLVRAVPQIQHGQKRRWWNADEQGTGMQVEDKRPTEEFPNLAWTMTMNANDVLILGPTEQPSRTLGEACFYTPDGRHQRVLVLQVRAIAQPTTAPDAAGPVANLVR
jgi:hypothetical protein